MQDGFGLVLADEHVMFLDSLSAVLSHLGHRVIAAVPTQSELFASVRAFHPHICVTDLTLRDGGGVEAVAELMLVSPDTRVVVLTADRDPDAMHESLRAGAAGFVHKSRSVVVLVDALARVAAGETVVEASLGRTSRGHYAQPPPHLRRVVESLTRRETECLAMITAGLDTAAMAGSLGVSPPTVRSHVQAVLTKLGVHSRLEAAAIAARYRLVPPALPGLHIVKETDERAARRVRS